MSDKGDADQTLMLLRSESDGTPNQNNVSLLSFAMTSSPTNNHSTSPNKSLNTSKESSFSSDKSVSPIMTRHKQQQSGGIDSVPSLPTQGSSSPVQLRNINSGNNGSNNVSELFGGNGSTAVGFMDPKIRPGEFVMRVLFAEFTSLAEKKIELVMVEPPERTLSKSLQRGEDAPFDQLLLALGSVSEHCLPSILRTLFAWYDRQAVTWLGNPLASGSVSSSTGSSLTSSIDYMEKEQISLDPVVIERRDMAVEFIFCLVLIEVLKQLAFHPGHHDLVGKIEDLAFAHFKYREGTGVHAANGLVIADLYAEVLGVLAQARFGSVRVRFLYELAELRSKEPTASITQSVVSLLMGMKFFRIKMAPIEDFEASFQFLTECAKYFLEVKQRDIKHALAGLFVEILVPVAASVKHEVNVPCLKSFVEMLYAPTLDLCTRSKHRLALFPLVTCLLCVSQRPFFLHNWHYFLAMCLSQLKSREPKMSRVALESLYRLLWAYMIRIKCESNSATQSRLLSIVNSLFPKGSKGVVPRDTPLNIFVKIIQFIAQERLDFAMREIVFELLSVGRPIKIILAPERMNIGLRAFLVAADSLQQKDGDPPMPRSAGVMPSGNTLLRVKKTFLNKVLTEDAAKSIGMASYYPLIRKVFADILRALDLQCGRPLLSTTVKEQEEITGDRKAKIDLFRTCVAAIPRLIPDGMSRPELLSLLSRLTLHIDEELRGLAYQSLQSLLVDYPDWRNDVLSEFITFTSKEVPDTAPPQLDNALRMLLQLLTSWRGAVSGLNSGSQKSPRSDAAGFGNGEEKERITVTAASTVTSAVRVPSTESNSKAKSTPYSSASSSGTNVNPIPVLIAPNLQTFHQAEGLALLMLCSVRASSRRLGAHMLKEIKGLSDIFGLFDTPVLDVLDKFCPIACEKVSNILPASEKQAVIGAISSNSLDLQWLTERSCTAWYTQQDEEQTPHAAHSSSTLASSLSLLQSTVVPPAVSTDVWGTNDPWLLCLKEFLRYENVPTKCSRTCLEAWPMLMGKITALFTYLEPSPVTDNRASLLRSSTTPRKPPTDRNLYFKLWRNYLLFGFRTVPPNVGSSLRCISPEIGISSSPEAPDGRDGRSPLPLTSLMYSFTPSALYKIVLPLVRSEAVDVRDLAVHSVGQTNHIALKDLFDDLSPYLREACDRKQENVRRRKRKDNLRLQILKVLKMMAKEKIFGRMATVMSTHSYVTSLQGHHLGETAPMLPVPFLEFLDSCKGWLETETDRDGGLEMKVNFCKSVHYLLSSLEVDLRENLLKKDLRKTLFNLCIGWAGPYFHSWGKDLNSSGSSSSSGSPRANSSSKLEFAALQAATSLLTAGPIFQASLLSEESSLYSWIDFLLSSLESEVSGLGETVVITLLEYNPDAGSILDWVVSRCFTGSSQIADACFRAIAILFSAREYPCDRYVAIINTALLYSGNPSCELQQTAFRLLQVLDRRFFGGLPPFHIHHNAGDMKEELQREPLTLDAVLGNTPYAKGQTFLSKQLSLLHPELTMPMFSEISWRMKSARSDVRQSLLRYLQPWLHNMELVEPSIPSPNVIAPLKSLTSSFKGQVSSSRSCSLCGRRYYDDSERLVRRGWGSTEATEMVLNNLLYLTAKFGEEHEREIEECWQTLCCLSPTNQRVILYYLLIVTGLAPNEVLPHAKRVLIYLFRAQPLRLLEDLMAELQTVESLSWLVERTETPPFYRLSHLRKTSSYSESQVPGPTNGWNWNPSAFPPSNPGCSATFLRINASELEKGTIHTKRRSAEESIGFPTQQPHLRSSSSGTTNLFRTEKARTISGPAALPDTQFLVSEKQRARSALYESESFQTRYEDGSGDMEDENQYPSSETIAAGVNGVTMVTGRHSAGRDDRLSENELQSKLVPLPMPEYGGYYAALKEFFPPQPVTPFHRCNMALMFLSELITEGTTITFPLEDTRKEVKIEWCSEYLPLMIHMAFLGLDHLRPLVHQHSYRFLINILNVAGHHKSHLTVAKLLLNQQTKDLNMGLALPTLGLPSVDFLAVDPDGNPSGLSWKYSDVDTLAVGGLSPNTRSPSHSPKSESPRTPSKRAHSPANLMLVIPDPQDYTHFRKPLTIQDMTVSLIQFLAEHKGQPLWACEDITARIWNIRSANQLFAFLQNTLKVFVNSFPGSKLELKWATVSLQIGLACSSRHYAGRSLQVYRALKVPLVQRTLCDILSRLVETVAETGDDMQGYVTELILTLETCVEAIPVEQPDSSDPWNTSEESCYNDDDEGLDMEATYKPSPRPEGCSSGELSPPLPQMRARSGTDTFKQEAKRPADLSRSRSAHSLSGLHNEGGSGDHDSLERNMMRETGTEVIPQVFWLSLSLLESDYEHEYLLALGLLEKVMERLPLDRLDCRDKIDRIQSQLQWSSFAGVVPLLLKGITNPNTYEQSLSVLCRFIPFLDMSFVDPTGETGFPLTVIAFMPYLLSSYDEPSSVCLEAAHLIAEVAAEKLDCGSQPLQHLATVMTLYSRRSFTKEAFQWNKCVIKYLYDSYSHFAPLLLGCLLDVLEKGPASIVSATLTILHCSFSYVDLTTIGIVSPELLRAIQRHLDGPHWRESLRILKLVVTRSSYLVAPAPQPPSSYMGNSGPPSMAWDSVSTSSSAFSNDNELSFKKELPGRTMEFTFDVSQTPVIGRRHPNSTTTKDETATARSNIGGLHQRSGSIGEMGVNTASSGIIQSAWKRPWQCQSRLRECLVSVLNACGQRVGLPKSPSVIFSQSSELLERQSSVASSTEEVSVAINDGSGASRFEEGSASDAHFRVFRDFDFLEYELESVDGESSDNFNWGVRRRPLSELGTEPETEGETDSDVLGGKGSKAHSSASQSSIEQGTVVSQSSSPRRPSQISMDIGNDYINAHNTEESSDDEDLGLSPLDEAVPQLQEIISSDPPTPQPHHSLHMMDIPSSSQISSPARSRRLSDTSIDSRSEDENTPSNMSPHGETQIDEEGETQIDEEGETQIDEEGENMPEENPAEVHDSELGDVSDGDLRETELREVTEDEDEEEQDEDRPLGASGIHFELRPFQDKVDLCLLYEDSESL